MGLCLDESLEYIDVALLDLSGIVTDVSAGVIRIICRGIGCSVDSDVVVIVKRDDIGELGLKFGGDIGSRDGWSGVKDIKTGFNVRQKFSVSWCDDRSFGDWVCKLMEGKLNIFKVMFVWRLMPV